MNDQSKIDPITEATEALVRQTQEYLDAKYPALHPTAGLLNSTSDFGIRIGAVVRSGVTASLHVDQLLSGAGHPRVAEDIEHAMLQHFRDATRRMEVALKREDIFYTLARELADCMESMTTVDRVQVLVRKASVLVKREEARRAEVEATQ